MLDVPSAVRAVRATASSERAQPPAPKPWISGAYRIEASKVSGRLQLLDGTLAVAELVQPGTSFAAGQRAASLVRCVAQADAYDGLLAELEALVREVEQANAWRASWDKPPIVPLAVVRRAKACAVGTRRLVDQVAPNARR